jgi:hypothetical protein
LVLVAEKQQIRRFREIKGGFSCFAKCALAESQQLPDNSEVKVGVRDITDLMLFAPS